MAKKKVARSTRAGPARVVIPPAVRDEVLRRCQRHCCMCFGLHGILRVIDGQIAHADRNRANAAIENLVYLCQPCHTIYDTTNNRVLSYTPGELTFYRDKLYRQLKIDMIEWTIVVRGHKSHYDEIKVKVQEVQQALMNACPEVIMHENPMV